MEFRLTYSGELIAASHNKPRASKKHEIRKCFHPQIRRLWEITPHLKAMRHPPIMPTEVNRAPDISRIQYLAKNFSRGPFGFVPLVTKDLFLWCGIDILFLRPSAPGLIVKSGDIDNRLKTIFDALIVPKKLEDIGGIDVKPEDDEDPFFVLLEDDRLIAKVSVEADTLLEPIGRFPSDNDARLIITVRVKPLLSKWINREFTY